MKELEVENARLKKMYAELSLVHNAFKRCKEKKAVGPDKKKEMVKYMQQIHQLSQRQACKVIRLPRSSYAYTKVVKPTDHLITEQLSVLADKHPLHRLLEMPSQAA